MSNLHVWRGDWWRNTLSWKSATRGIMGALWAGGEYWDVLKLGVWRGGAYHIGGYWGPLVITHRAPQLSFPITSPDNHNRPCDNFSNCIQQICWFAFAGLPWLDIKSEVWLKLFSHLPVKVSDERRAKGSFWLKWLMNQTNSSRSILTTSYSYNCWNNWSKTKINGSEGSIICR